MAKRVSEVLDAAADLIEPEGAWTQYSHAKDTGGNSVRPYDRTAVSFCAEGACLACVSPGGLPMLGIKGGIYEITKHIQGVVPGGNVPTWNDAPGRAQAEVVAKLREAAAKAREQGL